MYWIYILECEDETIYVGQTRRLYRRFWEHEGGSGCKCTQTCGYSKVLAIYPAHRLIKFFDYHEMVLQALQGKDEYNPFLLWDSEDDEDINVSQVLHIENLITEKMVFALMSQFDSADTDDVKYDKATESVLGGKYIKLNGSNRFPKDESRYLQGLPLCKCGYPCDVRLNDEETFYFRCAKKNRWDSLNCQFFDDDSTPCKYYQEYHAADGLIRERKEKWKKSLSDLFRKSRWLRNVPTSEETQCVGCKKEDYRNISYQGRELSLCYDCFRYKNDFLAKRYSSLAMDCPF